jgi:hypothetical protein
MNTALSTWQLVIMAVVPLMALIAWIATIFYVAREPARTDVAAAAPAGSAGTAASVAAVPAPAGQRETAPAAKEPVAA